PYLAGELGAAIIRGYQGESLAGDESILACAKHYIGYGEAVGARDACDTEMTYRMMREVFLPPFAKAVKAGCATVMTAYGSIDGTPFTASKKTLHTILREELGFDGFVVTDWDNVNSLITHQKVAADIDQASELAVRAGNDLIMVSTSFYDAALRLLRSGKLSESVVDDAVRHILTIKCRMGLFEHPEKKGAPGCIGSPPHLDAALRAARESVTLLTNSNVLPLQENVKRIAVIGANAVDIRTQYGDWTYFTHPTPKPDFEPERPYVTLLEGIQDLAQDRGVQVVYHRGCSVLPDAGDDLESAAQVAKGADVIVLAVGDSIALHGETKDRGDLALSGRQAELFARLCKLHIPIVTVLIASKPLCLDAIA
ncbi:MAG: glycoside hydrolase family 3 C-terminal domain-containing protein, partial [Firmicutes bacterium]|nr:glycoside hydrolase family 3 C-terminal domain-containing protein [Bacillota bacterium]